MDTLPKFLSTAFCPQDVSSSQAVHGSAWNQRETDGHMSVLARSQWFCALVRDSLSDLSVDTASGELCWQGAPLSSTPFLNRCMATAVYAVCRAARDQVTIPANSDLRPSKASRFAPPPPQPTMQLLSALREALLLRLLPSLVACNAPLAALATAAAGGARHLGPATAISEGGPEGVPRTAAAPGGGVNSAAALLMNANPAAEVLCRAAAELAVAASGPVGALPHPSTTVGNAGDDWLSGTPGIADNGDGPSGEEILKRLVALCCDTLVPSESVEIEKGAAASARGSGGGLSMGQVAASYTLTAVCVALASDVGACGDAKVRQGRSCQEPDGETPGGGLRRGDPGGGGGGGGGVLQMMLDVLCAAPQRLGIVMRQHLRALLLPALLGACAMRMSTENYAAATARCIAAMRGEIQPNNSDRMATAMAVIPPSLTVTSTVREAVATLAGLDARHVAAAVRHSPELASWLLSSLLPAALLAPGDRPTRVRALNLLRTLIDGGMAPEAATAGGGGAMAEAGIPCDAAAEAAEAAARGWRAAVGVWGRTEWLALADLLHVLEEHMYHLVQPVWSTFMPMLLERAAAAPVAVTTPGPGAEQPAASVSASISILMPAAAAGSAAGDVFTVDGADADTIGSADSADSARWSTATWLAVPILKACQHTNVSVRRMGFDFVLQHAVLPSSTNPTGPADWWAELLLQRPVHHRPLQHPPSGTWPPSPQQLQQQPVLSPGLWLLEQLLPVIEHDKISWECMPGCGSIQRHATAVRQLRDELTAFIACTLRYLMSMPKVAAAAPSVRSKTAAAAASAASAVQCCLRFALRGTQRATAAAFVLAALQGALAALSREGGRRDGEGGENTSCGMLTHVAAAVVREAGGSGALLRGMLLPLLTRQALQHPRDLQMQIHAAVLDLVPDLLNPPSVSVANALELLSAASAVAPSAPGAPASDAAGPATSLRVADPAGASTIEAWTPRFESWLIAVLDEHSDCGSSAVSEWLIDQLRAQRPGTAPQRQLPYLEALAAAAPLLTQHLQLHVLGALSAATMALPDPGDGGGDSGYPGDVSQGVEGEFPFSGMGVDPTAVLVLLTALHRSYVNADAKVSVAPLAALHDLTLAAAPRLLMGFWYRSVKHLSWDQRTAYGILQLAEVLSQFDGKPIEASAYRSTLVTSCLDWPSKLLEGYGVGGDAGGDDGSGITIMSRTLDQQLALLAAGCIACRTTRVTRAATTNPAIEDAAVIDPSNAEAVAAAVALVHVVSDLEASLELSPHFIQSTAKGGGDSSLRLELLPLFVELRWRLVSEVMACPGANAAISGPLRERLCERALEDLDCAPDAALPYILDTLLVAAPYREVLRDVRTAAVRMTNMTAVAVGNDVVTTTSSTITQVMEMAASVEESLVPAPTTMTAAAVKTSFTNSTSSSSLAAAADIATAGASVISLRLLQRIQAAVVSSLRGSRRVAPALAVKAPQLACHPALLLAGCAAGHAVDGVQQLPLPPASGPGRRAQRQKQQPQLLRREEHDEKKDVQHGALRILLADASKLATTTSGVVVPQLLQHGGSRVALATAAHLGQAVLQPHLELHSQLLLPLVHLLAFSTWSDRVDARGLLSRKFEPHQALPARAALCAWLERLTGPCHGPFLGLLMCALLRAACGCCRGALPPGLITVNMTAEDTADDAEVQTGSGALSSHNDGGAPAAGGAAIPRGPSPSCGEVTAAAVVQPQLQCTVWRQHSGSTVTSVTGPHGKSTQLHPRRTGPCLDASALSQDYSFLQAREASQSSTLNAMKVALWQTICLLARKLPLESAGGAARAVWQCMEQPHHHSNLRPLMQQALLALLDRWPEGVQSLLLPALRTYHTASYQVCVSVVIIGSLLLQRQMATQPAGPLAQQLLEALFPWALHHRHAVRVPVQTVIYLVLEKEQHRMAEQTTLLTDPLPESEPVVVSSSSDMPYGTADTANKELPCQPLQLPSQLSLGSLDGVRVFLGSNPEQVALRTRQALVDFGRFNLEFECSLEGLFGIREEVLMAVAAAGEALEVDPGYPSSWALHTRDRLPIDVLRALPAAVRSLGAIRRTAPADGGSTATATAAAGPTALRYNAILDALGEGTEEEEGFQEEEEEGVGVGEVRDGDEQMYGGEAAEDGRCLSTPAAAAGAPSYQLRPQLLCAGARCSSRGGGVAISAATALTAAADRLDALAAVAAAQCSRPTGLVVVASLLENVPNMAGLCRTCESLGCEALVLPSRGVISSEAFKRQAVTSERWLPLLEVGPRDLPAYLAEMRGRGYWLVGVEQAAGSVPLQAFIFPTHCLLLLGNEQSGVPQHLISALDACVEIPMLGVTRSLNAHVSGAMAVWQYVQQQQQRLQ